MNTPRIARLRIASASIGTLALMLFSASAHAQSNDACGPLVEGTVTCTAEAQPYPEGIRYDADQDLTIHLEDGLALAPDSGAAGVIAVSLGGSVVIDGPNADITTKNATGAVAEANGNLVIDLANVSTEVTVPGELATGIQAYNTNGTMQIGVDSVSTVGGYSAGIVALSSAGDIFIDAGSVSTNGFSSDGIQVAGGRSIDMQAETITSTGDYNWGVNVFNGQTYNDEFITGFTNVNVGTIDLTGGNAVGVYLTTYSDAQVSIGTLAIDGDDGRGVVAQGLGSVNVSVDTAVFTGQNTGGILAFGEAYGASVRVGTLTAENGGGIVAASLIGNVSAEASSVQVSGDFNSGVQAVSTYGGARIVVGDVSTDGFLATGLNADALQGDVRVVAGNVSTKGELSHAIRVFGRTTGVTVSGDVTTSAYSSVGILNSTTRGNASVNVAGDVRTSGEFSQGLWITARYGTGDIRLTGSVTTAGDHSAGIRAIGEDGQLVVQAAEVSTSGADSDGINARTRYVEFFQGQQSGQEPVPFTGDIDIRAGKVTAIGEGSSGISARGLGKSTILVGDVSSAQSFAIETNMIGTAAIDVRGSATSAQASAIKATAADVSVTIGGSATVSGAIDGIIVNAAGPRCVLPNPDDGVSPNPCPNPGDDSQGGFGIGSQNVRAAAHGMLADLGGSATIVNAGMISAGSGYAIRAEGGTVSLDNRGTITGAVQFAGGDDVFANSGTFVVGKSSDFGAGSDLFRNAGLLRLATATQRSSVALTGLERFENAGTIDLRNGAVGDTLTLPGAYVGTGAAALLLDMDLAGGMADQLRIGGAATGSTIVALQGERSDARLTDADGIVLVTAGAGTAADAFRLDARSTDMGLVSYALSYDATQGGFALVGRARDAAYRQLGVVQAADSVWAATAALVRTQAMAARDTYAGGAATDRQPRLWGVLHAGRTTRDWSAGDVGLDYRQSYRGGQIGYNLVSSADERAALQIGVVGSYTDSDLDLRGLDDGFDLSTASIGAYASYAGGSFFANLLAKYDHHDISVRSGAFASGVDIDGSSWGVDGEAGVRLGDAALFVEPFAGLTWVRTSIDSFGNGSQAIDFDASSDVQGRIGARVGGASALSNGGTLTFYLSGSAGDHFGDDYALVLTSGASQRIAASRIGTFGQGKLGVAYRTPGGVALFAEGQGEAGSGYDAVAGRLGVRLAF